MNSSDMMIIMGIIALTAACIPAASIEVSVTGDDGSSAQTVNIDMNVAQDTSLRGTVAIDGAKVKPNVKSKGSVKSFEQTHQVTNSGKHAEVYARVDNGTDISYKSQVYPKEGTSNKPSEWVLAEEWLDVGSADYIKASAMASFGALSAGGSTEVVSGSLTGYHSLAYTDGNAVQASQFGPVGEDPVFQATGENIVVSSYGRDDDRLYRLTTILTQEGSTPAQFSGRTEGHFGETVQYINNAQGDSINIEDLRYKPGDNQKVTLAGSGPLIGQVVSRDTRSIINDMLKFADSGDSISIGEGIYHEQIYVDRDLSFAGEGKDATIIDGSYIDWHPDYWEGSTFRVSPDVNASISGMTIIGGSGYYYEIFGDRYIYPSGGGIFNQGTIVIDDCVITGGESGNTPTLGGGIFNEGTVTIVDSTITENTVGWIHDNSGKGGGIYNHYPGVVNLISGSIDHNIAYENGGGIYNTGTINGNTEMVHNNSPNDIWPASNSSPTWP